MRKLIIKKIVELEHEGYSKSRVTEKSILFDSPTDQELLLWLENLITNKVLHEQESISNFDNTNW